AVFAVNGRITRYRAEYEPRWSFVRSVASGTTAPAATSPHSRIARPFAAIGTATRPAWNMTHSSTRSGWASAVSLRPSTAAMWLRRVAPAATAAGYGTGRD